MAANHAYPELSALAAFAAASQEGSLSAAAVRLGISQPDVSQAVQKLEALFGAELFDRTSRPMRLTPAGRLLRTRAKALPDAAGVRTADGLRRLSTLLPVIRFNDACLDRTVAEEALGACGIACARTIEADSIASALALVRCGAGWAAIPPLHLLAAGEGALEGLTCRRIEGLDAERSLFVLWRRSAYRAMAEAVRREAIAIICGRVLPKTAAALPLLAEAVALDAER